MRIIAALAAIAALSQTALPAVAQAPDCKSIADPRGRLACYDAVNSARGGAIKDSAMAARPALSPPPPAARRGETDTYVDSIGAEDARMNAQLKNICRGC